MNQIFLSVDFGLPGAVDTAGTRPYTGANPIWNNNSIFLSGSALSQTQTQVGRPTTVKVRVSNSGTTVVEDVRVDAYVMNPFVGPFQPFNAKRKLTAFIPTLQPGSGSTSSTDAHVATCMIHDPVQGDIAWTPTDADLADTTDGHLCLVANAYSEPDGGPVPDATDFHVADDPHQGQRNIAVLSGPGIKKLLIRVVPPAEVGEFALDVHQLTSKDLGIGERWLLRSQHNVVLPRGSRTLAIQGTHSRPDTRIGFSRKAIIGELSVDTVGELDLREMARVGRQTLRSLALQPHRQARQWGDGRVVLSMSPDQRAPLTSTLNLQGTGVPGSLQALDIVQRDALGRAIGGLRVLSLDH